MVRQTVTQLREAAEKAAETVIEQSWDSANIPVNPVEIAKRMGLRVYEAQLPGNVSGLLKREEGGDPEIYLDIDDGVTRRRFTCAHELGHFVRRSGDTQIAFVDRRDGVSAEGTNAEEIFANQFAAALLMPRAAIRTLLRSGFSTREMARHLNVSSESMNFRLQNLGLAQS